jgi:ribosomal protein S12 methylthiotransferase accessory factor YcaO
MTTKATPAKSALKPGRKSTGEVGVPIAVRVKPEHLNRLDAFAERKGISRGAAIQIAIAEMLERNQP